MSNNTPIDQSVFSDEFSNTDSQGITMLSKENALHIWRKYIDSSEASYFSLPDNNWIIKSKKEVIGQWLTHFNNNNKQEIETILKSSINWNDNDVVWFCISKFLIIESSWYKFSSQWINFLNCEDDCPIIINKDSKVAFVFYAIGSLVKIEVGE